MAASLEAMARSAEAAFRKMANPPNVDQVEMSTEIARVAELRQEAQALTTMAEVRLTQQKTYEYPPLLTAQVLLGSFKYGQQAPPRRCCTFFSETFYFILGQVLTTYSQRRSIIDSPRRVEYRKFNILAPALSPPSIRPVFYFLKYFIPLFPPKIQP